MFIKKFLLVSCIASGLVIGIWLVGYRKVFYPSRSSQSFGSYEYNYEFDSNVEISNVEGGSVQVIDEKHNLLEDKDIKNEEEVLFELVIPSINLKKSVYNMDSSLNNVDKNVEIL